MLFEFQTIEQLPALLQERQLTLDRYKLPDQPIPMFIGSVDNIVSCQVMVNEHRYSLPTPLKALDLCYKTFFVLNAAYPKESAHIWTYLQTFIYEMNDDSTKNYTSVNKLISALQK